jgi:ZU5 domain
MQATIGPTGGNIATSGGAQIVIPEGALAADTMIGVEQTSTGAPPLPAGVKTFGPVVAFTPHGTSFALPATITVPFDATSVPTGTKLALVKTDDSQARWEVIGALASTATPSARPWSASPTQPCLPIRVPWTIRPIWSRRNGISRTSSPGQRTLQNREGRISYP